MKVAGVVAAAQFKDTGELVDYKGSLPKPVADMAAQLIATVTLQFKTLSGVITQLSKMNWAPSLGWTYTGGDYTVAVMGDWGVFVETKKADFNRLFSELGERLGVSR